MLEFAKALGFAVLPAIGILVGCLLAESVRSPKWLVGASLHATAGIAIALVSIDVMPRLLAAFHRDMGRDKGLGPALGPNAHAALLEALARRGYQVSEAESDWRLRPPTDAALIRELAAGGERAIGDALTDPATWRAERSAASSVLIGHRDLFAAPPA